MRCCWLDAVGSSISFGLIGVTCFDLNIFHSVSTISSLFYCILFQSAFSGLEILLSEDDLHTIADSTAGWSGSEIEARTVYTVLYS
jgi:uncharacterized membrane protein YuzA (DUF378 family)